MTIYEEIDAITDEIAQVEYLVENGDISVPSGEHKIKILKLKLHALIDE